MYSADKAFDHATTSPEQMAFEPLLVQHGVDLVLVGHEHCYERIHPVVNGPSVCLLCWTMRVVKSAFVCLDC